MRFVTALFVSSLCFAALPAPPSFLLPDDVAPRKYLVDLTIDPNQETFTGWVRIEVELKKPLSVIWINAKDLIPKDAMVGSRPAHAEAVAGEFIGLDLDSPARAGRTLISIHYQGKLDDKIIVGPYRKKLGDDWYVFTSFTPIDARRAYPCFDEPRFKTPWEMTIHVKEGDKAFTNGREVKEVKEANGMKTIHFATTEPLPAEVTSFTVGPLEIYEGAKAGHGTPIRIITPRGHASEGKYAAQASVDVIPRLEAYTGIPYPFGKLDHLADPDFPFGATENPGLIVYRMRSLLAAPNEETPEKSRAIRAIESHEIAHQWFGDYVTQATWDDVWLAEGFATWLSAKVMDEEKPAELKGLAAVAARDRIMTTDDSAKTRPIRVPMTSREDTKSVYHQMVYQKGGAMLRMLDGWLGEDKVRTGLRAYLKQHAFGNATTADVETALRASTNVDPSPVMNSFLNQTGIPVIRAQVRCDQGARLDLEQINPANTWTIPVCWRANDGASACTVLDGPKRTVDLPKSAACPTWIYLNAGANGYYRTEWTAAQLSALGVPQLTAAERLMLVYDLRFVKPRVDVSALLTTLSSDSVPEVAKAAGDVIQGK